MLVNKEHAVVVIGIDSDKSGLPQCVSQTVLFGDNAMSASGKISMN